MEEQEVKIKTCDSSFVIKNKIILLIFWGEIVENDLNRLIYSYLPIVKLFSLFVHENNKFKLLKINY